MSKPPWATVSPEILIDLFTDLAKMLSLKSERDIPTWMSFPGKQWPMFQRLIQIAKVQNNSNWVGVIELLSSLPSSNIENHWKSFEELIAGKTDSQFSFHESKFRQGRILGPTTFQIKSLYEQVGLKVDGAELPDHVSIELEFMAYLCQKINENDSEVEIWKKAQDLFYRQHLSDWMPQLGQDLIKSRDVVWKLVGFILTALFKNENNIEAKVDNNYIYPSIIFEDNCSLCGFCVQVCPSSALQMNEDDINTALCLNNNLCIHCNKCVLICPEKTLVLKAQSPIKDILVLLKSPRALCTSCHEPTVSQAELDFTSEKLGHPGWLSLCLDCRSINMEKII